MTFRPENFIIEDWLMLDKQGLLVKASNVYSGTLLTEQYKTRVTIFPVGELSLIDGKPSTSAPSLYRSFTYDVDGNQISSAYEMREWTNTQETNQSSLPIQLAPIIPALPLPVGAATSANQTLILNELQLKADLTETQPVSVASLPLPSGAATSAKQDLLLAELQLKADLTETQPISGTVTANAGTNLNTSALNLETTQSAMSAKLPASLGSKTSSSSLSVTMANNEKSVGAGRFFGFVNLAATTRALLNRDVYNEQTTNAQRSLISTSANDTNAAGTGARKVKITYFDQTLAGPFTETVNLNGLAAVNTVATNICFIEKMEVTEVGSTGSNVGSISLKAAAGGGGVTIMLLRLTELRTYCGHHYVAVGKTFYPKLFYAFTNSTAGAGNALYEIVHNNPLDAASAQTKDFSDIRAWGQSSGFICIQEAQIPIVGPRKVFIYVTPESGVGINYRAEVQYSEV